MYSSFERNWFTVIVSMLNYFVILHAFAVVENAIEESNISKQPEGETVQS